MTANTIHLEKQENSQKQKKIFTDRQTNVLIGITLGIIILLGAFLRFYKLGAYGIGNNYYAATVKSMLSSWHNFFFASFEPGGSVTVDKPPLGFWIQAASATVFGLNGFALALPNALAGTLSIPLLYTLVNKHFNKWAGIVAALVLAVMPITIATERNNTIDGLLLFVLLLAAWAFVQSVQTGKLRFLFLGAFLVGLGFNIKMLQAFMPLPAFYTLYFFGSPHRWWKRILHLGAATGLLLIISFSWAIIVDLTPKENRPFIGSSTDNSVIELITGHNGIRRLTSGASPSNQPDGTNQTAQIQPQVPGNNRPVPPANNPQVQRPGNLPPRSNQNQSPQTPGNHPNNPSQSDNNGTLNRPPRPNANTYNPQRRPPINDQTGAPNQNQPIKRNPISGEVGNAGLLRLFTDPLGDEASWLIPFVLLGIPVVILQTKIQWPLNKSHLGLILWCGWLIPQMVYFSFTTGLFHTYYLAMLGPAIAALSGATVWALAKTYQRYKWLAILLTLSLCSISLVYHFYLLQSLTEIALTIAIISGTLLSVATLILLISLLKIPGWISKIGLSLSVVAILIAPLTWSLMTTLNNNPNANLPRSGPAEQQALETMKNEDDSFLSIQQEVLLEYLLKNKQSEKYLLAVTSSHLASPFILETGLPVLTFGGFNGSDKAVSVEQLSEKIESGNLRFVLGGNELQSKQPEIANWVNQYCAIAEIPGLSLNNLPANQPQLPDGAAGPNNRQISVVYDCKNQ